MEPSAYLEMAAMEARHWWFTGRRRVLAAIIRSLRLPPRAEILELGSGTGGNLAMLSGFGAVTAVEMNDIARDIAAARAPFVELHPGLLPHDLPLAERCFDLVCLFDVLEHIEDDAATLHEIRARLKPGAAAIITVPAYKALFGPHDKAHHHKRRYEQSELREKLAAAGLRAERLTFINTALLPAAFALRWLDRALNRAEAAATGIPPAPVNALLATLFGAEAYLLPRLSLPFGLSLLAVVRKED